jgi:membrane protease YdiL (CAAX protease family)
MQRIFNARTELEAHDVRFFLESQGIRAVVTGESVAFTNFSFTPTSEPSVVVEDADAEHAIELLKTSFASRPTIEARGDWKCTNCGDSNGEAFELCWNCAAPRSDDAIPNGPDSSAETPSADESPAAPGEVTPVDVAAQIDVTAQIPAPLPSIERAWSEIILLLVIMVPWPLTYWLFEHVERAWDINSFGAQWTYCVAIEVFWATCALFVIWRGGEPWSRFGLQPLRPLMDLFSAGIVTIVTAFAASISNGLFIDFARGWLKPEHFEYLFVVSDDWIRPEGGFHVFLLLCLSLSIGFTEELIFRGILISRCERILGSTFFSVLVSSVLFGMVHWDQGVFSAWNALGIGLIFGTLFAKYRNLWPLVFAHAMMDFVVFLRQNSY